MAKADILFEKYSFEKHIEDKLNLSMDTAVRGEILGWAGNYLCGYVMDLDPMLDCTVIPCVWDLSGRCLFNNKHQVDYDLKQV